MAKRIAIDLNPAFEIAIDPAPIAQALALESTAFLRLLEQRKISQLCERGTGEDEGLYRASFYHRGRRARVVVDRQGRMVGEVEQARLTPRPRHLLGRVPDATLQAASPE